MTKMPSSSCPSPGWATFRNILMGLIAMQLIILIAIGFSTTPEDESSLQEFLQPAEEALDSLLASIRSPNNPNKQNTLPENSVSNQFERIQKLSDEWEHVGPFDTPGAFTNNFLPERKHPAFRKATPSVQELDQTVTESMKQVVSKLSSKTAVTPCRYHDEYKGTVRVLQHESCRTNGAEIVAFNSMPFARTWCNKTIPPHSIQRYNATCQEPASLYNIQMPPVNIGKGALPLPTLKRVGSNAELKPLKDCDIPCLVTMDTCKDGTGEACLPESSNWIVEDSMKFIFSQQTTAQNGNVMVDPKAFRTNQYYATRSFSSEVPLSHFSWQTYGRPTPAMDYTNATKATSFFKSKLCNGGSIRSNVWANYTALTTRLDSYGTCFHTTDVPQGMSLDKEEDRQALLKKYMFHLVIDSTQDPDYVDKEVWEALRAGVIPVYFGASNIKEHVPPNSIISAADYKTKVATAERINQVANNRSLWETHHEWRKHDFPNDLKAKYDFLRASPLCRMCRWSVAKKYGLAWNHERQRIEEKTLNGRPCFTKRGVVKFPFSERWMTPTVARPARGTCNWRWPNNTTIIATDLNVNRTVHQHDGVIDIVVRELRHTEWVILRIEFENMKNEGGAYFPNVHQQVPSDRIALMTSVAIQDEQSRVTVLCDWPTKAYSPSPGVIQIEIQGNGEKELRRDEIRALRVIPEDLDPLRDVRTEYAMSPYSKRLIEDFVFPLELFVVAKS